ncbi:phage minor structural protein, N-terminal region [Evansella caseinilytica]|uniref:Phage minor structural protein, N-terminal region n=1 Tax=Evansella caseinilytica TaxID=1503961 RepID=A0A1H3TLX0_9BACI|nr:phage tail spike protein [Evansella caseinilytica]SDZ51244.1 phage minor structural protein, N-terminal region [Evansella caseinilytica]
MSQIHITDGQTDQILSVITAEHILSNNHHKSLKDTLETFSFETFADMPFSNYLGKLNRVIIPNEDGKYIEFVIFEAGKYRSADGVLITEVYTSASYQLLKKSKIIEPQILPGQTTSQAVAFALYNTEWQPGVITFVGSRTFEIDEHTNPYSFLKRVANEFELELRFRVEIDGNKITGRYVDLVPEIGEWQGREIELGKDLHGIRRIEEAGDVVTALVGLGPVREDGTRLEALVEDNEALQRWGRNGQHLIETYEPESTDEDMTLARLTELTKNELEKRVNAVVEYKCDIADLENVPGMENKKIRFGDTIKIKDAKFKPPLYLEARVHTQERDIVNRAQKTVELGDFIEYTEAEVMSIWQSLQAQIRQKISMSDLREVTYTKPEIDQKDEIVYQDGTVYTDQRSDQVKQEAEQDATDKANRAEDNSKQYTDNVATQVEQNSREFTEQYAEKKVSQSTTPPSSPSFGDLWIDISGDPHIWKRWSGTQWEALERTNLNQMLGELQSDQIANGAVVSEKMADLAVTLEKIANNSVDTTKIAANSVTAQKIAAGAVETDKLAANSVIADKIAAGAINADKIAAGTITSDLISTVGLDAGVIKFGTMSGQRIQADTITATQITSGTITTDLISTTGLDAGVIKFGTMSGQRIQANSISADRLNVGSLSAITTNFGTMTAGTITGTTIIGSTITANGNKGRVEIDQNGWLVRDGSGNVRIGVTTTDQSWSLAQPAAVQFLNDSGQNVGYIGMYSNQDRMSFYSAYDMIITAPTIRVGGERVEFSGSLNAYNHFRIHSGDLRFQFSEGNYLAEHRSLIAGISFGRTDNENAGGIQFRNYNTSGTGWYSIDERRHTGVDIVTRNRGSWTTALRIEPNGNMYAAGSKSGIVDTENYGTRALYAYEGTMNWFFDLISASLENGESFITINPMFLETITDEYFVKTFTQNCCSVQVISRESNGFWVRTESEEEKAEVVFEVYGLRKGYEDVYMEEINTN